MNAFLAIRNGLILSLAVGTLSACASDNDDLDKYINEVKAKPGGFIEPLPEITPYEIFTYVADAERIRSPFIPDTPQVNASGVLSNNSGKVRNIFDNLHQ
jgi:type IV pilus assembly protein PilP